MKNILHVFQCFTAARDAGREYAKTNNLKFNIPNMEVVDGDTRNMFRHIQDKQDAVKYAGMSLDSVVFYDDYQEIIPEDAYNFLISRVRKEKKLVIDNEE